VPDPGAEPGPESRRRSTAPVSGAPGTSGWVVWVALAGLLLVVVGTFHVAQGLGALLTDQRFLLRDTEPLLDLDATAWGWIHVVLGSVTVVAGFLVFGGRPWARAVGVAVAVLSAAASLSFLAEHPAWALTVIAVDAALVVALTRHGSEIRAGG
jgi:hypothetical protein